MWQRRALQTELGASDALVQLALDALKRFSAAQSPGSSPTVSFSSSESPGSTATFLPPGTQWRFTSGSRSVSVANLTLTSIDSDSAGNARARWAVSFGGADTTRTSFGKTLYGGIQASSPLGELVQQYEGLYGKSSPGLIASSLGKPIVTMSQSSQNSWSAAAELVTPLIASTRAANGAITVSATSTGAALESFTCASFDATGTATLKSQLTAHLGELLAGRIPGICPEMSIAGTIPVSEAVMEVLPVFVSLRVIGTPAATALAVFVSTTANAALPLASTDLTAGADSAYLLRESGFQKILAFCFRTNRFPKHWHTDVVPQATTNGSVNVTISIDIDSASISLVPFSMTSARQEDRADLQMVAHSKVTDVRNPDGSAVSDDVRNGVVANATFNYTNDLYFSNVGMPGVNPDPQLETWFLQWRSQVSRRFSLPFVNVAGATLLERSLNGPEKVMLSRQNLTF